ncbi:hypothetical protein [Bacillus sp. REN3]|uniref:hypothetical protein n=1 Tax=Bacillus sp. REN3 TaxID=2802440 RepID=UPI001AEDE9F4|nr:hypothetical protein [Bacillus sp. REN3]
MDISKKHILGSYKNEQEAIEEIESIKEEMASSPVSSVSGYNFEVVKKEVKYPINSFSAGKMDLGEPAFKDYADDPSENQPAAKSVERPLPEREINNRVR